MEPITDPTAAADEREVRAGRNQAMFRAVNDKIRELNETFAVITGTFTIALRMRQLALVSMVEIKPADYEAIRANPRRFAVLPGRGDPLLYPLIEDIRQLRVRLQTELDSDPG